MYAAELRPVSPAHPGKLRTHSITSESRARSPFTLETYPLSTPCLASLLPTPSLLLHLWARLEALHAHLGDLISACMKPIHFTGPSRLRNATAQSQENSCKPWHCFFYPSLTARSPQSLRTLTVRAVGSDVVTYLIHTVNCGVCQCSCHQLFLVFSMQNYNPAKMTNLIHSIKLEIKHCNSMNSLNHEDSNSFYFQLTCQRDFPFDCIKQFCIVSNFSINLPDDGHEVFGRLADSCIAL